MKPLCLLAAMALVFPAVAFGADEARRPIFASLYAGGAEYDVDFRFAGELGFDPEEDGDSFGLGVGYEIDRHWFIQLDYTLTDGGDVDIDQVFLSLNYQRPLFIANLNGVVGLVAGEGRLEWNNQPDFADAIFDDLESDQSLYGLQLGLNYDISRRWSINLTWQIFDQAFRTDLETPEGRIDFEHKNPYYLMFGLRFHL